MCCCVVKCLHLFTYIHIAFDVFRTCKLVLSRHCRTQRVSKVQGVVLWQWCGGHERDCACVSEIEHGNLYVRSQRIASMKRLGLSCNVAATGYYNREHKSICTALCQNHAWAHGHVHMNMNTHDNRALATVTCVSKRLQLHAHIATSDL